MVMAFFLYFIIKEYHKLDSKYMWSEVHYLLVSKTDYREMISRLDIEILTKREYNLYVYQS